MGIFRVGVFLIPNERVPIYLTKTLLKGTSNCIFNIEKVDLEES